MLSALQRQHHRSVFVHSHGEGSAALSNFDACHLLVTISILFCFSPLLPSCRSYISFVLHPVSFSSRTGIAGRLFPFFFLKFSVLYFADKASKLITFLSPSFVNYFS